jgi:hypothetical protein
MVRLSVVQIPNLNSSSGASGDAASMPPAIRPQLPWQVNEAGAGSRARPCVHMPAEGTAEAARGRRSEKGMWSLSLPVLSLSKNGSGRKTD